MSCLSSAASDAKHINPAHDKKSSCCAGLRMPQYLLYIINYMMRFHEEELAWQWGHHPDSQEA